MMTCNWYCFLEAKGLSSQRDGLTVKEKGQNPPATGTPPTHSMHTHPSCTSCQIMSAECSFIGNMNNWVWQISLMKMARLEGMQSGKMRSMQGDYRKLSSISIQWNGTEANR